LFLEKKKKPSSVEEKKPEKILVDIPSKKEVLKKLKLKLKVPTGQISTIVKIVNYLKSKFSNCEVEISISATSGEIERTDYEDKILETFKQTGIEILDE